MKKKELAFSRFSAFKMVLKNRTKQLYTKVASGYV